MTLNTCPPWTISISSDMQTCVERETVAGASSRPISLLSSPPPDLEKLRLARLQSVSRSDGLTNWHLIKQALHNPLGPLNARETEASQARVAALKKSLKTTNL